MIHALTVPGEVTQQRMTKYTCNKWYESEVAGQWTPCKRDLILKNRTARQLLIKILSPYLVIVCIVPLGTLWRRYPDKNVEH